MTLHFEPILLEKQQKYRTLLQNSRWEASDYSFINLWGWAAEYQLQWAWDKDIIWIRQQGMTPCYWAPVGNWDAMDWNAAFSEYFPEGAVFNRIPEALVKRWMEADGVRVNATPNEDHWDYLYSARELIELKGNRFHKKKNLLNQFRKKYPDHEYLPMDTEKRVRQACEMQDIWCLWQDCESQKTLEAENRVIKKILGTWFQLDGIFGGTIHADGEIAAFTVGESMSNGTVIIHFEKGLNKYKGIYQAINQMFLAANDRFEYVNREQDIGDEGLRKAKRSYNPVDFVKKYTVTVVPE